MDLLRSPKWKKANQTFEKMPPSMVFEMYEKYCEALHVLGNEGLADAIEERVNSSLCQGYGNILFILKALAGSTDDAPPQFVSSHELTWQDIVDEDPLQGEHWQEIEWTNSEDEYEQQSPPLEAPPEQPAKSILILPRNDLVVPPLPATLTQAQIITEIKYMLMGYASAAPKCTCSDLTIASLQQMVDAFEPLCGITSRLREFAQNPVYGDAFAEIWRDHTTDILDSKFSSILACLAHFQKLLLPYKFVLSLPQDYNQLLDTARDLNSALFSRLVEPLDGQLTEWTNSGELGPLISVYQPTLEQIIQNDVELSLPAFVHQQNCIDAGRFSHLCRHLEITMPRVALTFDHSLNIQIVQIAESRLDLLLGVLKPRLIDAWDKLSRIYLGFDTRIIEFLVDLRNSGRGKAVLELAQRWPRYPFRFDAELRLVVRAHDPILHQILPLAELQKCWMDLCNAFKLDNTSTLQRLDTSHKVFAAKVRKEIQNLDTIAKL